MKQIHLFIKAILIISIMTLSQKIFPQCLITYDTNGTNLFTSSSGFVFGQGFIAACNGDLEYFQLISNSTGTISDGTLKIYSGNTTSSIPLYTQSYSSITINQVNDPIRFDITDSLNLVLNNQYTFEITIDNNVNLLADFNDGYAGGTAFQNGNEISFGDFIFDISISNSTLSIDDFNEKGKIKLFPNPSNDYVIISNLQNLENYSIVNVLGQEVLKRKILNSKRIDITNLKSGLYFLKFESGKILKFIKE